MNQCEPSQLNIILRGDHNLSFDAEPIESTSEFSTRIGEYHFLVMPAGVGCRLPGIARHIPRLYIADIAECSPVIAGGITAPARERNIIPATIAAAARGQHQMIMVVGQQLNIRGRRVHAIENTGFIANGFDPALMRFKMTARTVQIDRIRHAFL